jgi:hypothetical protein
VMSCSMKRKPTAGTTRVNRAAPRLCNDLEHYCRDLDGWPRSWMEQEKDVPPGENLVACFRPFLEALAASDLSPKTIQQHVDNLWTLGGEIITHLNENPSLRRKSIQQILDDRIDEEGGSLVYALESEELQQRVLGHPRLQPFLDQTQNPRIAHSVLDELHRTLVVHVVGAANPISYIPCERDLR